MGALEKFLNEKSWSFDVCKILSRDVEEMDSAVPPSSVYKYFSASRSAFFDDPVIRFTQKTSLNDPFELTKRWKEFAGSKAQAFFLEHLRSTMVHIAANKGLVLEMIKEELAKKGIFLGPDQMAAAAHHLLSPEGNFLYEKAVSNSLNEFDKLVEFAFRSFNDEEFFAKFIADIGIFSLAEDGLSEQMWGLYANSGSGFVIEFNTNHEFFKGKNGRSRLRKVKYTDERNEDFLSNPLALFQIKAKKWSFEQEWRMLKGLTECGEKRANEQEPVYVCRVSPGMMRSVIFGYNYNEEDIAKHGAKLRLLDPELHVRRAFVNASDGVIEVRELV